MFKRILIVDDSEMVRNYHSFILKMFKYEVSTAENGMVALEKVLGDNYNLIVTDINMPKMDGYELIKKIRENGIDTPIIVISTEDEVRDKMKGLRHGANTYMVKPTEPEKLVSTINLLLKARE